MGKIRGKLIAAIIKKSENKRDIEYINQNYQNCFSRVVALFVGCARIGDKVKIDVAEKFLVILPMNHVFLLLFVLCPGLLPPQVLGQSSGRATIHQFLQIICEEIPWATHLVSGGASVKENCVVNFQLLERLLITS